MFGKNKILKPENSDGLSLKIQEIFATFQGEGPFVGYPSVFIRLGGCNLACDFCDTEFDDFVEKSLDDILVRVQKLACIDYSEKDLFVKKELHEKGVVLPIEVQGWFDGQIKRKLVVITGGEPMRQEIAPLCRRLIEKGFLVQIETNGTIFRELPAQTKIICSPKVTNGKYHAIRSDLLTKIDAFKFIISTGKKEYSDIFDVGQGVMKVPIYLQPMDEYNLEKNRANIQLTLELAKKYDALVSLQMHKILGIA